MLGIPERGLITVHIKGNTATVTYGVTGSSMRINLGAAFRELFKGEEGGITITIKVSENKLELFHKEDEQSLFPIFKKSANMLRGMVIVADAKPSIQPRRIIIDVPTTTYL
jgi:hypothetical protein